MKVSKWVDFGQEVDVEISIDDIRNAMKEAFANVTQERPFDEGHLTARDVLRALNDVAPFLSAVTEEMIAAMNPGQRAIIQKFLSAQADRYTEATPCK